jgi:hypothetical protein
MREGYKNWENVSFDYNFSPNLEMIVICLFLWPNISVRLHRLAEDIDNRLITPWAIFLSLTVKSDLKCELENKKYFSYRFIIMTTGSEISCPIHADKAYTISMLFFHFTKAAVSANDR